jgi:hypothetical protein
MEPESSLPHLQVPASCLYPELAQSRPDSHIPLPEDPSNIILPSTPGPLQSSHLNRFPHQNPVHVSPLPIYATWSTHPIILDFMTRTILAAEYKSWSSSLWSLLHSPAMTQYWGFFHAFSSVVRQMPGYNSQRRGTARTS